MSFEGRRRVLLVAALIVGLCAALSVPAAAVSPEEARLEATQAQLGQVRSELESAQAQQSQDAASFAKAERQLAIVMEALNAAEAAVDRQQQAVDRAAERLDGLEQAFNRQQSAMTARAVRLYKGGSFSSMGSVLASGSPREALQRTALVDVVNRADQLVVEQVTITSTAITAQRKELKTEQEALERVAAQQREITAEAEDLRNDRALALAATSNRVEALRGEESHLQAESREIAALARRAEATAAAASRAAAAAAQPAAAAPAASAPVSSSGWTWPTSGTVTSGFGYRWGRMHEGLDIGAPSGTPIYAATSGVVSYAGVMGGYGNFVMIDHGGGVTTAYAHQTTILVSSGTTVSAGQQIGTVGSTGNSTGPHLHFEVRVGGSPQDPMGYLP